MLSYARLSFNHEVYELLKENCQRTDYRTNKSSNILTSSSKPQMLTQVWVNHIWYIILKIEQRRNLIHCLTVLIVQSMKCRQLLYLLWAQGRYPDVVRSRKTKEVASAIQFSPWYTDTQLAFYKFHVIIILIVNTKCLNHYLEAQHRAPASSRELRASEELSTVRCPVEDRCPLTRDQCWNSC